MEIPRISILMAVKNGMAWLPQTVQALATQSIQPCEILAVDSGSTDGTPDFLKTCAVRVDCIPPSQFHHARTRNRLARAASGDICVFLNQDAVPCNPGWLAGLVEALYAASDVVAACSMEMDQATGINRGVSLLAFGADPKARGVWLPPPHDPSFERLSPAQRRGRLAWATVSAAVDAQHLRSHPFDPSVRYGEDLEWALRVYRNGKRCALTADSRVFHDPAPRTIRAHLASGIADGFLDRRLFGARESTAMTLHKLMSGLGRFALARINPWRPSSAPPSYFPYGAFLHVGRCLSTRLPLGFARFVDRYSGRR